MNTLSYARALASRPGRWGFGLVTDFAALISDLETGEIITGNGFLDPATGNRLCAIASRPSLSFALAALPSPRSSLRRWGPWLENVKAWCDTLRYLPVDSGQHISSYSAYAVYEWGAERSGATLNAACSAWHQSAGLLSWTAHTGADVHGCDAPRAYMWFDFAYIGSEPQFSVSPSPLLQPENRPFILMTNRIEFEPGIGAVFAHVLNSEDLFYDWRLGWSAGDSVFLAETTQTSGAVWEVDLPVLPPQPGIAADDMPGEGVCFSAGFSSFLYRDVNSAYSFKADS